MIVTIFGATGMPGKHLVKQALYKGYTVKAFGRNLFNSFDELENLQLITGTLFDEEQVFNAVKGSDAILSVIGGGIDGIDKTRSLGMKNIVEQMQRTTVKRIVAIAGIGILNAADDKMVMDSPDYPPKLLAVAKEYLMAYQHLKNSSLNWTFVCPPEILDADPTGTYHTAANYPPVPDNQKINAGDLAMFMLNELVKNDFIKERVGISN
ncbi:MAG: NAD(P)H-binding protein [Ferruginibacter sp.]